MEQYIMELYKLAESCNYGEMKDEMLRDRLVVGTRDNALSKRLQLDAALAPDKAKNMARQQEALGEQQQLLKGTVKDESSLDQLRQRNDSANNGRPKTQQTLKYQPSLANAVGEANTLVRNALLRRLHVTHVRPLQYTLEPRLHEAFNPGWNPIRVRVNGLFRVLIRIRRRVNGAMQCFSKTVSVSELESGNDMVIWTRFRTAKMPSGSHRFK